MADLCDTCWYNNYVLSQRHRRIRYRQKAELNIEQTVFPVNCKTGKAFLTFILTFAYNVI